MPKKPIGLVLTAICMLLAVTQAGASVNRAKFHSHDITLKLDVANHRAELSDTGDIMVTIGWNLFYLKLTATVDAFTLAGEPVEYLAVTLADSASLPPEIVSHLVEFEADVPARLVLFNSRVIGEQPFSIKYSAEFFEDVSKMRFSRERVGGEVSGTISEQGAYLSPAAYYYPVGDESLVSFKLTADIPEAWESVSDGNQLSSEVRDGRKVQTWGNPFKSDGCMFMAAPYVIKSTMVDSVEVWCYFFEADTGLFDQYLPATADYIRMYSELIGPYPYKRFTVAENFFSTGYGMPAWTLLGQRVLQMPWIVKTSLGHEVLHNWWGNSVYVDYERGNWCEGATVYGADYRYKLMQSEDAAKSYRKDILKQYLAYVDEGNDFPIREFTSRSSPDTRSIGYGKAMMVFHMIEEEIGTEAFFDAWKLVYKRHIGEKISWEEWIAAFEETSSADLSHIIPQWIDRAGAPMIKIDSVIATVGWQPIKGHPQGGDTVLNVGYRISQDADPPYTMMIPKVYSGGGLTEPRDMRERMTGPAIGGIYGTSSRPSLLEIDPDYHLFRRLHPEEVEPIVSAILGADEHRFVCDMDNQAAVEQFTAFASNFTEDSMAVNNYDLLQQPDRSFVPIILNPPELPAYLVDRVKISEDSVSVQETSYPRSGHTFVLTGEKHDGFGKFMVIITDDYESLPRLGQLVPHYGKYSYLVFMGSRNIGKGQWEVSSSPLKVTLP